MAGTLGDLGVVARKLFWHRLVELSQNPKYKLILAFQVGFMVLNNNVSPEKCIQPKAAIFYPKKMNILACKSSNVEMLFFEALFWVSSFITKFRTSGTPEKIRRNRTLDLSVTQLTSHSTTSIRALLTASYYSFCSKDDIRQSRCPRVSKKMLIKLDPKVMSLGSKVVVAEWLVQF